VQNLSELKNYYQRCLVPSFAFHAGIALCLRLFWALLRRVAPGYHIFTQPKSVVRKRRKLLGLRGQKIDIITPERISPGRLKLALGYLEFLDKPNWSVTYSDPEIADSLHRWNWLLWGLTDDAERISREQGLQLMRSWLCDCLHQDNFSKDAYSTAERIVNGSLFLLNTGDGVVPKDIQAAFQYMGRQIASHLEYYEGDLTGNHAFNNARGLLFSGVVALLPGAVDLALAISKERLPKLVTSDGFLREGSSHYHFLFTRWVLEMCWIAKFYRNEEITSLLESYAGILVERCWFFLVKEYKSDQWHIPLIGDVSPDFPPSWLLSLPWSKPALEAFTPVSLPQPPAEVSWSSIFGLDNSMVANVRIETLSLPQSFWHRIEHGILTLFVHASPETGTLSATHKHNDLCGFAFYVKGKPILVDCGRIDYTNSLLSLYGREAFAHNAIFINDLPPAAHGPTWFRKSYRTVDVSVSYFKSEDSTTILIKHNGFSRLKGIKIAHERRFILRDNSLIVEDQIFGSGEYNINLRFHWAPGFDINPEGELFWNNNPTELIFSHDPKLQIKKLTQNENGHPAGIYFPEYGIKKACMTVEMNGLVKLPVTIRNQIILKS